MWASQSNTAEASALNTQQKLLKKLIKNSIIFMFITENEHNKIGIKYTRRSNILTIILLKESDDLVIIENDFIFRCVPKVIKSPNRFS